MLFLKKPQAIDFHFLKPYQAMSGDDNTVNRTFRHFLTYVLVQGSCDNRPDEGTSATSLEILLQ